MTYTLTQKREAYKKLSDEVKNFIMDNETTDKIQEQLKVVELSEEQENSADSEILYAMYGLQSLDDAVNNIGSISGKSITSLQSMRTSLWNSIFSNLEKLSQSSKKIDPVFAKKRVAEIVNKYGLSSSQATVLENEVMSVIDRNLDEKITATDLVDLLNISNILAEQIVYELENRVFERGAVKSSGAQTKIEDKPKTTPTPATPEPVSFGTTLNVPKEMMKPAFQNTALDSQKPETSTSIGVPRYATEDIYKTTQPTSNPIVNNKLNTVTPGIKQIETKYQKDPYREPVE